MLIGEVCTSIYLCALLVHQCVVELNSKKKKKTLTFVCICILCSLYISSWLIKHDTRDIQSHFPSSRNIHMGTALSLWCSHYISRALWCADLFSGGLTCRDRRAIWGIHSAIADVLYIYVYILYFYIVPHMRLNASQLERFNS